MTAAGSGRHRPRPQFSSLLTGTAIVAANAACVERRTHGVRVLTLALLVLMVLMVPDGTWEWLVDLLQKVPTLSSDLGRAL